MRPDIFNGLIQRDIDSKSKTNERRWEQTNSFRTSLETYSDNLLFLFFNEILKWHPHTRNSWMLRCKSYAHHQTAERIRWLRRIQLKKIISANKQKLRNYLADGLTAAHGLKAIHIFSRKRCRANRKIEAITGKTISEKGILAGDKDQSIDEDKINDLTPDEIQAFK